MTIKYTRKNNHDLHKKVTKQSQSNPHWSSRRKNNNPEWQFCDRAKKKHDRP